MLALLHLSDIHFAVFDGDSNHDLENHVRELMLEDIAAKHEAIGDMNAVLVVGDVAKRGQQEEYLKATEFLDRVCQTVGCPTNYVICVPGNHDIDRTQHDCVHDAVRQQLHALPAEQLSDRLHTFLKQSRGAEVLLSPLSAYNEFALPYGCDIASDKLTWTPKSFDLGSGKLVVYGITSSWICDGSDSDEQDENKAVVGAFQCGQVAADPESVSVAMIHHPHNWVRDAHQIEPWMNRAHISLTGHEHEAGITLDAAQLRVAIASGAVNPERTQSGWIPAYNIIQIKRHPDRTDELHVRIHVRCWQGDVARFGADQRFSDPYDVAVLLRPPSGSEKEGTVEEPVEPEPSRPPEPIDAYARSAVFRIMRAAPDVRHRAAEQLGLIGETDIGGLDLDRAILDAASAQDKLGDLDERIRND